MPLAFDGGRFLSIRLFPIIGILKLSHAVNSRLAFSNDDYGINFHGDALYQYISRCEQFFDSGKKEEAKAILEEFNLGSWFSGLE